MPWLFKKGEKIKNKKRDQAVSPGSSFAKALSDVIERRAMRECTCK